MLSTGLCPMAVYRGEKWRNKVASEVIWVSFWFNQVWDFRPFTTLSVVGPPPPPPPLPFLFLYKTNQTKEAQNLSKSPSPLIILTIKPGPFRQRCYRFSGRPTPNSLTCLPGQVWPQPSPAPVFTGELQLHLPFCPQFPWLALRVK